MLLHIIILIDVSYSMQSHIGDFIRALNAFIYKLKETGCKITIGQFSVNLSFLEEYKDIKNIPEFNVHQFNIFGTTALYDAIYLTINSVSKSINSGEHITKLFIISDGDDNASFRYTKEDVDKIISISTNNNWQITHCHTDMNLFNVPTITYDVNDISNIFSNLNI
jgi:uncharacterized protein YegL